MIAEQIISLAFRLASNDNMSGVCSDTPVIKKQDTGMSELGGVVIILIIWKQSLLMRTYKLLSLHNDVFGF